MLIISPRGRLHHSFLHTLSLPLTDSTDSEHSATYQHGQQNASMTQRHQHGQATLEHRRLSRASPVHSRRLDPFSLSLPSADTNRPLNTSNISTPSHTSTSGYFHTTPSHTSAPHLHTLPHLRTIPHLHTLPLHTFTHFHIFTNCHTFTHFHTSTLSYLACFHLDIWLPFGLASASHLHTPPHLSHPASTWSGFHLIWLPLRHI